MKTKIPTILILLDGLPDKLISKALTPFLATLTHKNDSGFSYFYKSVIPCEGFCERTVIFSGQGADKTDRSFLYSFANTKHQSPYRYLPLLPEWCLCRSGSLGTRVLRKLLFFTARQLYNFYNPVTAAVPVKYLPHLYMPEESNAPYAPNFSRSPSIFDLLRKESIPFSYLSDQPMQTLYKEFLASLERKRFWYVQISETDHFGHLYGPDSDHFKTTLLKVDMQVKKIYSALKQKFTNFNFIVLGDHGMVPVTSSINIFPQMETLRKDFQNQFLYFIDSTFLRLFVRNPSILDKVTKALDKLLAGITTVARTDKKSLSQRGLHLCNNYNYGNLFYYSKPGTIFYPSFYDYQRSAEPKGMHGFLGNTSEWARGFFIFHSTIRKSLAPKKHQSHLANFFPTLLKFMGLRTNSLMSDRSLFI